MSVYVKCVSSRSCYDYVFLNTVRSYLSFNWGVLAFIFNLVIDVVRFHSATLLCIHHLPRLLFVLFSAFEFIMACVRVWVRVCVSIFFSPLLELLAVTLYLVISLVTLRFIEYIFILS